jgi:hypothetical protein
LCAIKPTGIEPVCDDGINADSHGDTNRKLGTVYPCPAPIVKFELLSVAVDQHERNAIRASAEAD